MKFRCVVVLYNVNYKDSNSYTDLVHTDYFQEDKLEIICVDNSVKDFKNSVLGSLNNHFYINMRGNKGLSKAYNTAIDYIMGQAEQQDMIVLMDDDTHISDEYFEKMEVAMQGTGDIYLPIVMDQLGILSPSLMKRYRCRRCKRLDQINEKNICGINSGMCIDKRVFDNYRYDEKMFLDYVDHNFIRDMKHQGKKIVVVDTMLHQNFSSISDSYEQTMKRFSIFKNDLKVFYSRGLWNKLIYAYVIGRRRVGIFCKFKRF